MQKSFQHNLESLLETEVDRREFLAYVGATLLGVLGVSGLLKTLAQSPSSKTNRQSPGGYGSSTYGGRS
jgi:hypothetical protein